MHRLLRVSDWTRLADFWSDLEENAVAGKSAFCNMCPHHVCVHLVYLFGAWSNLDRYWTDATSFAWSVQIYLKRYRELTDLTHNSVLNKKLDQSKSELIRGHISRRSSLNLSCIGFGRFWLPQWNEYNWNATSGGKFEAFRSQSFHARLNTAKTKIFNVVLMRPDKTEWKTYFMTMQNSY